MEKKEFNKIILPATLPSNLKEDVNIPVFVFLFFLIFEGNNF